MNYESMSDHEINMMVTSCVFNLEGWSVSESNISFYHCGIDGNGFYEQYVIDYCNNPADMWPIIVDSNIETSPLYRGEWCASVVNKYTYEEAPIYTLQYTHKNPLRAAAIVFLMMQEGK